MTSYKPKNRKKLSETGCAFVSLINKWTYFKLMLNMSCILQCINGRKCRIGLWWPCRFSVTEDGSGSDQIMQRSSVNWGRLNEEGRFFREELNADIISLLPFCKSHFGLIKLGLEMLHVHLFKTPGGHLVLGLHRLYLWVILVFSFNKMLDLIIKIQVTAVDGPESRVGFVQSVTIQISAWHQDITMAALRAVQVIPECTSRFHH